MGMNKRKGFYLKKSHFAIDEKGKVVEAIRGLGKKSKQFSLSYFCGGCKKRVFPYTDGEKQLPHFRHQRDEKSKIGCGNNESYIHWKSKESFAEFYKNTSEFELILDSKIWCNKAKTSNCFELRTEKINLKKHYPQINVEQRDGVFIPDCEIYNYRREKIYIEMKHKSGVSQKKIDSGIPIIEIHTFSENVMERIIREKKLDTIDNIYTPVKLYNFDKFVYSSTFECGLVCYKDGTW